MTQMGWLGCGGFSLLPRVGAERLEEDSEAKSLASSAQFVPLRPAGSEQSAGVGNVVFVAGGAGLKPDR